MCMHLHIIYVQRKYVFYTTRGQQIKALNLPTLTAHALYKSELRTAWLQK